MKVPGMFMIITDHINEINNIIINNNNNNNNNNLLIYSAPISMKMIKGALHIQY